MRCESAMVVALLLFRHGPLPRASSVWKASASESASCGRSREAADKIDDGAPPKDVLLSRFGLQAGDTFPIALSRL